MSGIEVALIGIGVVFLVLGILTGATVLLGRLCQRWEALKVAKKDTKKVKEKGRLVAIVSAAVASYLSGTPGRVRIKSVRQNN